MIQARAVGNAVFVEHPGGCGDLFSWSEETALKASSVAGMVNSTIGMTVAELTAEVKAEFSPPREPTTNERHLLNLLSWREQEAAALRKEMEELRREIEKEWDRYEKALADYRG